MRGANVFWISIDSLRKDFLHIYNPQQHRRTMLDDLAEQGCIFDNAFAGGNWTMPSHATMLTGLEATSHMIWSWQHRFASNVQTAFDIFHRAGYTVGCFAIPQLRDLFSETPIDHAGQTDDPGLLTCFESQKPFFVFWHTYQVHYPYGMILPRDYDDVEADYDHPSRTLNYIRHLVTAGRRDIIFDSYRRAIQQVARFIRGVVTKLNKLGKFEKTYFVITADHGEAWRPHTTFHCNFNEEVVRVPLAISGPGLRPSRAAAPVSLVSLLPTVLELCEIGGDGLVDAFDGESLLPRMNGQAGEGRPVLIAGPNGARSRHRYLAIRHGEWMLIAGLDNWWESFHRVGETGLSANWLDRPLPGEGRQVLEEFRSIAQRHSDRYFGRKERVVALSTLTEKKLRALGYL
ncbi:MAG: hypothetical protein D6791_09875 [Chloroflexi bacterium]|nr:MAG: hypothetical protein D6791_09875 [Chloroflexota bacterium]